MNWTLSELASLRGSDAFYFALFCIAGIGLYYSIRYNLKSR